MISIGARYHDSGHIFSLGHCLLVVVGLEVDRMYSVYVQYNFYFRDLEHNIAGKHSAKCTASVFTTSQFRCFDLSPVYLEAIGSPKEVMSCTSVSGRDNDLRVRARTKRIAERVWLVATWISSYIYFFAKDMLSRQLTC